MSTEQPKPRDRPIEKPMPNPILDTPENIALALVTAPPKAGDVWNYLKKNKS